MVPSQETLAGTALPQVGQTSSQTSPACVGPTPAKTRLEPLLLLEISQEAWNWWRLQGRMLITTVCWRSVGSLGRDVEQQRETCLMGAAPSGNNYTLQWHGSGSKEIEAYVVEHNCLASQGWGLCQGYGMWWVLFPWQHQGGCWMVSRHHVSYCLE